MTQVWINSKVNGEADTHQYNIHKDGNMYRMLRSTSYEWANPGDEVGLVGDLGDDVLLVHGEDEWVLHHHEVEEILSLLLAYNNSRIELRETKTIKSI